MGRAFAHFQPGGLSGTMRVHPNVMRGKNPKELGTGPKGVDLNVMKNQGIEGLPDIVTHEATHFLNEPNMANLITDASKQFGLPGMSANADQLATALRPFTGHAKYGPSIINQHVSRGDPGSAIDEALSYLGQTSQRHPASTWLNNVLTSKPNAEGIGQFSGDTLTLLQEALNAALKVPGVRR